MHVISKRKLRNYYEDNTQAEIPLTEWYFKMKECNATNLSHLKKLFNSVDPVKGYTVFKVGGNNYRLVTAIHYNNQRCYIREIWTHAEYSKHNSQKKLRGGQL